MAPAKTTRYSYSAFLRSPTSVLPRLETEDVVLERRNETNLVLTIEPRAGARAEGTAVTGRLLADLERERPEVLAELLERELPWLDWLPAEERHVQEGGAK